MEQVQAIMFDVFGTVVDWRGTIVPELKALGKKHGLAEGEDWEKFAWRWRMGYITDTQRISGNIDALHREILDQLLNTDEWSHVGKVWDEKTRDDLNTVWHRLNGWPDTLEGLHALKEQKLICALSNGDVRKLVDMAKHAKLPWDMIFSVEFFGVVKPDPKAYLSACHHLSLLPSSCALVASHIGDLRGAAKQGMRTIYIRRPGEPDEQLEDDRTTGKGEVKTKDEGGEVDIVVDSFTELAEELARIK